jgi:hypothetical protein
MGQGGQVCRHQAAIENRRLLDRPIRYAKADRSMTGLGHEPTFQLVGLMSALPLEADFLLDQGNVGLVPRADMIIRRTG